MGVERPSIFGPASLLLVTVGGAKWSLLIARKAIEDETYRQVIPQLPCSSMTPAHCLGALGGSR